MCCLREKAHLMIRIVSPSISHIVKHLKVRFENPRLRLKKTILTSSPFKPYRSAIEIKRCGRKVPSVSM